MTAEEINKKLEKMYKEYIGVFNEVSKYSDDYSYPTFIKCNDKYAQSKTKVLFMNYESDVWFREAGADNAEQQKSYCSFAPWVYVPKAQTAKDFMSLYQQFISSDFKISNTRKSEYWDAIRKIESYFPKKQSWATLFSYFFKSDINYRNKSGKIKVDKTELLQFTKEMERVNYEITAREIEILNPDIILIFSSGKKFGNGKYFMEQVLGESALLKFVPESRGNDDRVTLLYLNQTKLKHTEVYMLPNEETCINEDLSGSKKAFRLLMDQDYLNEQSRKRALELCTA